MFEARPTTERLVDRNGTVNTTWEEMTKSLGEAFDQRKAGRSVDTRLLYELSRYERDPMPQRLAAAELSAMGAIDGKAFEQITNNANFKGTGLSLEDRVAFALLFNGQPKALDRFPMSTAQPAFEIAAQLLDKPVDGEWLGAARTQAKELLEAAKNNTLLDTPAYAKILADTMAAKGQAVPAEYASSPRALMVLSSATDAGATPAQARQLADRAKAGELDPLTFRTLATPGTVHFTETFDRGASAPRISLDEAAEVAARVKRGELDLGQLHGFMVRFGTTVEGPTPLFSVKLATELIAGVNKGEVSEAGLAKALDPKAYFPTELSNRIWDHFFSGKDKNGGGKYTVDGIPDPSNYIAPFTLRLQPELVRGLANSDEKLARFARAFQSKVEEALPKGVGVVWDHIKGGARNELAEYAQLMRDAIDKATAAAGF
jgi:hypothetical protein